MGDTVLRVPAYRLYGESHDQSVFGFFHIEPLAVRNIPNNWRIALHSHPDFEQFSILLKGKCTFRHDGQEISVGAPSCVFTPANVVHEFAYELDAEGVVISVSSDFIAGLPSVEGALNRAALRLATIRLVKLPTKDVLAVVKQLVSLLLVSFETPDNRRRDLLRYLMGCLLLELDRAAVQNSAHGELQHQADAQTELYRQFQGVLRSVIGSVGFASGVIKPQSHTVESLATRLSTTVYVLNAACRFVTGAGAHEVVQNALIEQATRLLLYSNFPIKEVAFMLGYSHASHFARFFRKRRGMSPEQFRTRHHAETSKRPGADD
ncbi:helix-turn-helix domain-containing protein [Bradyrhizobium sp. TM239]|nr:helix-turn-helix domain-containing protein [Bradyrhizobium sp. TM239]